MNLFSGMKLIKNWFGMGCEGGIWMIADNQWVAPKYCLFSVGSPISFFHVAGPEATVREGVSGSVFWGRKEGEARLQYQTKTEKKCEPKHNNKTLALSSQLPTHTTPLPLSCPSLSVFLSLFFSKLALLPFLTTLPAYEKSANKKLH